MSGIRRLLLVDASIYIFRAWHALPESIDDADGQPANAVHGFLRFLLDLIGRERPQHVAIAFDEALESSFRNALYPLYKANREPAPAALKRQFEHCKALARALGLVVLADPHYEADDLIGSLLEQLRPQGFSGLIVSPDKDLSQLLRAGDQQWDYARDQRWDAAGARQRYGVAAERIPDWLGLAGDAVDNIPGIPGIGSKTASALLTHFGSLDALLQRLEELPFLRLRGAAGHAARLREHAETARLSRRLATIACDARLPAGIAEARRGSANQAALRELFERLKIGPITRRRALDLAATAEA